MAQFRQPDHSKGDPDTIGGYIAVHDRPAAFEGSDGFSYSVELLTDATGEPDRPFGAYLLFVKWARVGAQTPEGHLESEFLARGTSEDEALRTLGTMRLNEVKRELDLLIERSHHLRGRTPRKWWDAMNDDRDTDA
jgi:hypothetical protein